LTETTTLAQRNRKNENRLQVKGGPVSRRGGKQVTFCRVPRAKRESLAKKLQRKGEPTFENRKTMPPEERIVGARWVETHEGGRGEISFNTTRHHSKGGPKRKTSSASDRRRRVLRGSPEKKKNRNAHALYDNRKKKKSRKKRKKGRLGGRGGRGRTI